jgi:serine/threonine protein phosphatase PrpC
MMKNILFDWNVYFDNTCKEEDLWGHYKTPKGDLYVVMDGVSNHDGSRTGKDVVNLIDQRLNQNASRIKHRKDLIELIHAINTESTTTNEGAYAAIAGLYHRGKNIYAFGAGDVSIIAKKVNGKLIQVLPLDLQIPREEAERLARSEIGTRVDNIDITQENIVQRINQYIKHGLCNAVGLGENFSIHDLNFNVREGSALLLASDGITDPFMQPQNEAGRISMKDAPKLYQVFNESEKAEDAVNSIENIIWNTQVNEKIKLKPDDRTALFIFMNSLREPDKDNSGLLD